jgi:ribose transport system substrate-binding protein
VEGGNLMRKYFKYSGNIILILIFITFNYVLVTSLKEEKTQNVKLKPKIVLIAHVYSNPYWQYVKSGAEAAAKKRNAVIDFEGPDSASADKGIQFINMAFTAKVSGIITYVQDKNKYNPIINKVIESGIPLVTVDGDASNSKRLAYVGTDNVFAGVVGAKEMIYQIGLEGNIGIIMGGRTIENQMERVKGFSNYIKKNSNIVISDIESSDSYLLESELAAKKILINNKNIKAIFCTSALDGIGAAKAIDSMGLKGKIKVVCFDDLTKTLDDIKDGDITSSIVQQPYLMGYKAVNIIMDNVEGKKTKGIYFTDVVVVRKKNINTYRKQQGDDISEDK